MTRTEIRLIAGILCTFCAFGPILSVKPKKVYADEATADITETSVENVAADDTQTSGNADVREDTPGTWELAGEEWRFLDTDGSPVRNDWVYYKNEWYYFDSYGYMVTGKKRIKGLYYYFCEDGSMATGWLYDYDRDRWYYANEEGTYTTGWLYAGGGWYYFNSSGRMVADGRQLVDGIMYNFYENGRMIGAGYEGLKFYNSDGVRDSEHDITIRGERNVGSEEKNKITEAFSRIPSYWVQRFVDEGWELIYYTDRKYFSAPETDQGIYYVRYKTDMTYKKIKFTDPDSLVMAFGEFIAQEQDADEQSGNNTAWAADGVATVTLSDVAAAYNQYNEDNSGLSELPSYFNDKSEMIFAKMFENYTTSQIHADIRTEDPSLAEDFDCILRTYSENSKPEIDEMDEEGTYHPSTDSENQEATGPARDESLKNPKATGPASETAAETSSETETSETE